MASIPASGWTLQAPTSTSTSAIIINLANERLDSKSFTNELYHISEDNLTLHSTASHRAQITAAEQDDALLALKQSMAEISDHKKATQTQVAKAIIPDPKNRFEAAKQLQRGGIYNVAKTVGSPSLGATSLQAPTSHPASTKAKALRHAVIHLLAMRPLSAEDTAAKVRIPVQELKGLLQTIASQAGGKWTLGDKACKELDVWRFKYTTQEDRQDAINNAIRAYDRQRLGKTDRLWQLLLPKEERDKGKVLSRLHLGTPSQNRSSTPDAQASSPRLPAKKSGMERLLSKDPKKTRIETVTKENKRKAGDSTSSDQERPAKRQATAKKAPTVSSDDDAHSANKSATQLKPLAKASTPKDTKAKPVSKSTTAGKTTPKIHSTTKTKAHISPPKALHPTVPSPLGAARPRNTSDVSDRSGISQRRNGVETPRGLGITSTPRTRHDTITSVDADRPKLHKRLDSQDKLLHKTKLSDGMHTNGHHKTSSTSSSQNASQDLFDGGSSDSSVSIVDNITFEKGIELARKFQNLFYPQYAKLYDSIELRRCNGEAVSAEETKKLLDMHKRLREMKQEIVAASERQHAGNES
ncbi:hypothetical protein AMS68_003730 [Peltaster fructicola]|uniref:Uncharacterized protein n=1 Tax=Peltaster fructicola TaxID=286661 RepID=A0A6H0XU13_9PEZI|nr:hypothetical protein AMS68_003730 [Peltaster fructicola]